MCIFNIKKNNDCIAQSKRNERGQVAVEYVLILVVAVLIALILMKGLVSRNPNNPGALIAGWQSVAAWIGEDKIEE
ncbi:MAG: hypothetical protein A2Z20_04545 [Bdellovibrionales bacterium RBG_16_40_8]|nr:MAG: hypothetical protein A2Z20_04545 [Bdellovibrionales bacterium RBG_16_40_8]